MTSNFPVTSIEDPDFFALWVWLMTQQPRMLDGRFGGVSVTSFSVRCFPFAMIAFVTT
ncbi:hypothetical protein NCCP2716_03700 [Sporosarcina sp. NCCP-2716]|nr:hypothetical protein NCCP2716_03700 [Sporosarcina sp. NCCP-2716]